MHLNYYRLRKLTGKLHLWLGMASGIIVIILGITGCLYAFIDELKPIVYYDRLFIDTAPADKTIPLRELNSRAEKALHKKVPLLDIEILAAKNRTIVFRYRERNDDANLYTNYFKSYDKVYLNPYTGRVLCVENTKWEFFNLVVMMHCTLLLGYWGKQIITWSTIIFMLMLVSGIILWWPKNEAASKKRFRLSWRKNTSWKRKNYDLHQIPGFYICLITFFIALAGLSMILPKLDEAIQFAINGGKTNDRPTMTHTNHLNGNQNMPLDQNNVLDQMLQQSVALHPDALEYRLFPPKGKGGTIIIKSYADRQTHYADSQDSYDQFTAGHLTSTAFSGLSNGEKAHELEYDIHVGAVFGLAGKILVFMVSLITATLPVSGFLIWKGRKNKTQLSS